MNANDAVERCPVCGIVQGGPLPHVMRFHRNDATGLPPLLSCRASRDGECGDPRCPQLRDNEPHASGRHCPLDVRSDEL